MSARHILNTRFATYFGLMCLALFVASASAHAQSLWQSAAVPVQTMTGTVLVLPEHDALLAEHIAGSPDTRISIALEGDYRVYRAQHKGKDHQVHMALDGAPRHLAFDLEAGRFRDILPSLRIEMNDYASFDTIVQQAGGTGGKVYEALGFALIQLPDDLNPAEVAAELSELHSVTRATIQLRGPLYVPM